MVSGDATSERRVVSGWNGPRVTGPGTMRGELRLPILTSCWTGRVSRTRFMGWNSVMWNHGNDCDSRRDAEK
jgi:hypothetical protein